MTEWARISIPKAVFQRVEQIVRRRPELGYKSVADFAVDSIRLRIVELEKVLVEKPTQKTLARP